MTATLEEGLFYFLTNYAGITAIVGHRIYPDSFPEDETLTAIVYTFEDDQSMPTQQGPSALRQAVYKFDIWADRLAEAMAAYRQLRKALDGYRGLFKDVPIVGVFFDSAARGRDPETGNFNVSVRFTIHYQEI